MLALCGADVTEEDDDGTHVVRVMRSALRPFRLDIPADPSQAAFWVVAGCIVPGSDISVDRVYVGAGRRGFLDVLVRMGAALDETPRRGPADLTATAAIRARFGPLEATTVAAGEITGLDEVPVLAVAAACATGTTVFSGVGELRVKESDRLEAVIRLLHAFGAAAEARGDDLVVHGSPSLSAGTFDAGGDHRMAMAAVVAAARADGTEPSTIAGFDSVATSYPAFADHLALLAGSETAPPEDGGAP
jgi:3-phosphoshikimate 1-carboxyvinyltransferase